MGGPPVSAGSPSCRTSCLVGGNTLINLGMLGFAFWCLLQGSSRCEAQAADVQDPTLLRELTQTLEEEIKLASRPQVYLLLDLSRRSIFLKGHGLDLHRSPVLAWHTSAGPPQVGAYRLKARPPVTRPKAVPGQDSSENPINLEDMPTDYVLPFDNGLVIAVIPSAIDHPWSWLKRMLWIGWGRLAAWVRPGGGETDPSSAPNLVLTLSLEEARGLAWTVTEGMVLIVGRTETP